MTDDEKENALTPEKTADGGIDIVDAVLPQWPALPWTPFPNRWSSGPSLVELDAYGDFAPERRDHDG